MWRGNVAPGPPGSARAGFGTRSGWSGALLGVPALQSGPRLARVASRGSSLAGRCRLPPAPLFCQRHLFWKHHPVRTTPVERDRCHFVACRHRGHTSRARRQPEEVLPGRAQATTIVLEVRCSTGPVLEDSVVEEARSETNVPAEYSPTGEASRVPASHVDPRRSTRAARPPAQGSAPPVGLIWRVRDGAAVRRVAPGRVPGPTGSGDGSLPARSHPGGRGRTPESRVRGGSYAWVELYAGTACDASSVRSCVSSSLSQSLSSGPGRIS